MNLYQLLVKNMNTVTSGQELSQELNMTRAGVWKGIKQLKVQGLIIDSLQSQGYQLKSTQHLLNKEHLESLLPNTYIEIHDSLGSTNEYAKGITQQPALIITSHQTDGKGRRGKSFYSPKDKGLYMSYVPSGDYSIEDTGMLIIRSALALQMAISQYFKIETEIKWLNDIYLRDRKLAGILIEGSVELQTLTYDQVIIGIGLNLEETEVRKDLEMIYGSLNLKNYNLFELVQSFIENFSSLKENDLIPLYRSKSMIFGRHVILDQDNKVYKAIDIDNKGALIIENEKGERNIITHGEVSLKLI